MNDSARARAGNRRLFRLWDLDVEGHVALLPLGALLCIVLATGLLPHQEGPDAYGTLGFWLLGAASVVVLLLSILAHELAHALVARASGRRVEHVVLLHHGSDPIGGDRPASPWQEFAIAASGAGTTLVLGGVAWAAFTLWPDVRWVSPLMRFTAIANLLLGLANLIPAFPMDGGRLLRSAAWAVSGNLLEATRFTCLVAKGLAVLMALFGTAFVARFGLGSGWLWIALLAVVLWFHASQAWRTTQVRERLRGLVAADVMEPVPRSLPRVVSVLDALTSPTLAEVRATGRAFLVEFGGGLGGIVTLRDLRRIPQEDWASTTVGQASHRIGREHLLGPRTRLEPAWRLMGASGLPLLPVVHDGAVVGVLTRTALSRIIGD